MTFNKWYPERGDQPRPRTAHEQRAIFLRLAWWVSTLMLVVGYGLMALRWNG